MRIAPELFPPDSMLAAGRYRILGNYLAMFQKLLILPAPRGLIAHCLSLCRRPSVSFIPEEILRTRRALWIAC